MTEDGEPIAKEAWKSDEKETKDKMSPSALKKNIPLEASCFSIVCSGFVGFNVYYWTRERHY